MKKSFLVLAVSIVLFSCKEAKKTVPVEKASPGTSSQGEIANAKSYDLEVGCGKCSYQQDVKSCVGAVKIADKVYKVQGIPHKHSRCEHGAEKATVKGLVKDDTFIAVEIPEKLK